eukprot:15366991-Ditylum_brightwellii.AAC.2
MEHEVTERTCKECELQRERCHQDFMMMMIIMVTGAKSPSLSISLPSPSSSPSIFISPTKGDEAKNEDDDDALEREIAKEMVLHDTAMHMHTPPSPLSSLPESEKAQLNKIREVKNYLK